MVFLNSAFLFRFFCNGWCNVSASSFVWSSVNLLLKHPLHCRKVCSLTLDKWSKAEAHKRVSWATEKANEDPTFISRIITGDGSWIYGCDPETKQHSLQWKSPQSPRAKNVWKVRSSTRSMLIVFLNVTGIVHRELVPPNTTVNCLLLWRFEMPERKCEMKKTGTLVQTQLAPS
jgi:hypothetical protein